MAAAGSFANAEPNAHQAGVAAAAAAPNARPVLRSGTLGERLLMGMGMPVFGQGEGGGAAQAARAGATGAGRGNGGVEAENALLNAAAGLESGDFLSNMLGLGDGAGGGLAAAAQTPRGARALWNTGEGGRPTRGQGRDGGAGSGRGARGAAAAGTSAGGRGTGADGRVDLEHVRQGLLTLHTLLSGTTSRRRSAGSAGGEWEWPGGDDSSVRLLCFCETERVVRVRVADSERDGFGVRSLSREFVLRAVQDSAAVECCWCE